MNNKSRQALLSLFGSLVLLSKPGIVRANTLTLVAGYLFAMGENDLKMLLVLMIGTLLIISGSCILNNILDIEIDRRMIRTKERKEALEVVGVKRAILLSALFVLLGITLLLKAKLYYALIAGVIAFISYVFIYTPLKKKTPYALQVGTLPGALSLIAGYLSKSGFSGRTTLLLFALMVCWQMVHFLGIALYRKDDYKNALVPTYPNILGIKRTRQEIRLYAVLYLAVVALFSWQDLESGLGVMLLTFSLLWVFYVGKNSLHSQNEKQAGKKIFISSLPMLLIFCTVLMLQSVIR